MPVRRIPFTAPVGVGLKNPLGGHRKVTVTLDLEPGEEANLWQETKAPKRKPFASLGAFVMVSRLELFNLSAKCSFAGAMPFLLLLYLASVMSYNNTYTALVAALAADIGKSERDVRRGINALVAANLVKKFRPSASGMYTYFVNPNAMARGREKWVREVQEAWRADLLPPAADRDRNTAPNLDQELRGLVTPPSRSDVSGRRWSK